MQRNRLVLTMLLVGMSAMTVALSDSVQAQVVPPGHKWDVSLDYSVDENPNPNNFGAWSYGRIDYGPEGDPSTQLDTFTLYDENGQMIDIFQAWQAGEDGTVDTLGAIAFNPGERDAKFGITLDEMEVDFIPDQSNQVVSTVKFTAPIDGSYEVQAEFQDNQTCCAGREGDAWVISDAGGTLFHVEKLVEVDQDQQDNREGVEAYQGTVALTKGQSIYFASGKGWQVGGGDHVDLRAIVTLAGGVGVVGDFNGNGVLDANDIDQLSADVRAGTNTAKFDVTGDLLVTQADREMWINSLANTYVGDSSLDGQFNSGDFVIVFAFGEYEDNLVGNSTWGTGDWTGDAEFNSGDFVAAFVSGGYDVGPRASVAAVPEPTTGLLMVLSGLSVALIARRRRV